MFDRHQAEITVMQFTGHSLPVHHFVTARWDFYLVPFYQPSCILQYQPKRRGYNYKDKDNSPITLNDKNHQASSQKFKQL